MSLKTLVPLCTKTVHTNFHVDRTNGCAVIAIFRALVMYRQWWAVRGNRAFSAGPIKNKIV